MEIQPIRTEQDHEAALREIARLMESDPTPGSQEADKLEVLATLVEDYERNTDPVGPADPVETIQFHLERLGWSQAKLAREANIQTSHLSAVLNRRRKLSLTQIQKLSAVLEIPADQLIDNPYADESRGARP